MNPCAHKTSTGQDLPAKHMVFVPQGPHSRLTLHSVVVGSLCDQSKEAVPEVVTPLCYTVGFIHTHQRQRHQRLKNIKQNGAVKPFWRHIQHPKLACLCMRIEKTQQCHNLAVTLNCSMQHTELACLHMRIKKTQQCNYLAVTRNHSIQQELKV